jgi:hypothetical protein
MAIPRGNAFAVFDDLLAEGFRPTLSGFRSGDGQNPYWPGGTEGFFVSARLEAPKRSDVTIDRLTAMHDIAARHGLVAWFSGFDSQHDDDPVYGVVVTFEADSGSEASGSGASNHLFRVDAS